MSAEYPVVAFLQNCWFRPGTNPETIRLYLSNQKFRRKVLEMSMTGRRLKSAFGEHYRQIWWDNASEYVAPTSPGKSAADPEHMNRILDLVKPRAVICFGAIANQGMQAVWDLQKIVTPPELQFLIDIFRDGHWKYFPHPNARGLLQSQLNEFAAEIISRYF